MSQLKGSLSPRIEPTILGHMAPYLRHRVADGAIGAEQLMMLPRVPLVESWEFLRDSGEETDDHSNGDGLHIVAELVHCSLVL